ncbi:MAG: hypothetical protein PHR66_09660 [Desulfuromonadaceae bacterium]|nr:hypothetical protein [Desulfuromonadaceae bacterium]
MTHRLLIFLFCVSFAASPAFAQEDLQEKIRLLEQQIQEIKTQKLLQKATQEKSEQCMKAVGREKFCTCVGNGLPREVNFEQYVHTLVTPKETLGYAGMTQEQKSVIDATIAVREKCVEKGFFN